MTECNREVFLFSNCRRRQVGGASSTGRSLRTAGHRRCRKRIGAGTLAPGPRVGLVIFASVAKVRHEVAMMVRQRRLTVASGHRDQLQ